VLHRPLRYAREELDFLRGAVLDGQFRRDYAHIGLTKADFRKQFLRFKKYIRGTAQWKRAGHFMSNCWDSSNVLAPLGTAERKQLEAWIEAVALDEDFPMAGQEHLLTGDELFQVFTLLNHTYYSIIDFLLLPDYFDLAVGPVKRRAKSEKKRRSGSLAKFKGAEAGDAVRRSFQSKHWELNQSVAELEHRHLIETDSLAVAIAGGMIGGLTRRSKRLFLGHSWINEVEKLHKLPCFTSLLRTLDTLFKEKGYRVSDRDAYLDGLLVHYFGPWYFTEEDSRRVHNRISSWRSRNN